MPIQSSFSGSEFPKSSPFYFGNNNLGPATDLDVLDIEQNVVVQQAAGLEAPPPAEDDNGIDESNEGEIEVKQGANSEELRNVTEKVIDVITEANRIDSDQNMELDQASNGNTLINASAGGTVIGDTNVADVVDPIGEIEQAEAPSELPDETEGDLGLDLSTNSDTLSTATAEVGSVTDTPNEELDGDQDGEQVTNPDEVINEVEASDAVELKNADQNVNIEPTPNLDTDTELVRTIDEPNEVDDEQNSLDDVADSDEDEDQESSEDQDQESSEQGTFISNSTIPFICIFMSLSLLKSKGFSSKLYFERGESILPTPI